MEIIGLVKEQPELRFTPTGKAICGFKVATEDGTLVRVTAWEELAEQLGEGLYGGDKVRVFGSESSWEYQTPDGETKTYEGITARRVQVLEPSELRRK